MNVYYNLVQLDPHIRPGRNYHRGDPLVQVAVSRCPAATDHNVDCWLIVKRLREAHKLPAEGDHQPRAVGRRIRSGDVISVGDAFFDFSSFGFAPMPERPPNITHHLLLPHIP